jgi:hypothetical protein
MAAQAPTALAVRESTLVLGPPSALPPVNGAELFTYLKLFLSYYVEFPDEHTLNMTVVWIVHACARDRDDSGFGQLIWRASPRLMITSKQRGSGKSTLLDLILMLTLSQRGKVTKITAAKLAKVFGKYYEVACLDEAKTLFGTGLRAQELQGILLSGYTRNSSYEVSNVSLSTFGACAYAAKTNIITEGNDTLADLFDRSLKAVLQRPGQLMPEVDEQADEDAEKLGMLLVGWTDQKRAELKQAARDIAAEDAEDSRTLAARGVKTTDLRRPQLWRILRACARTAGGDWEDAIRAAQRALDGGAPTQEAAKSMAGLSDRVAVWRGTGPARPAATVPPDDETDDDEEGD